jgi:molybdate transport system ATP-binding protein
LLYVDIKKKLAEFTLDIKFSVDNNILVLFGPSGCGKTTTLRCIAGLIKPDDGEITNNGRLLFSSEPPTFVPPHRRKVGYMFQEFALFPHMNVKSNIWYGVKGPEQSTEVLYKRLIRLLKIEHLGDRFTDRLSGGEKQRVALARALMAEPEILLLDEPLSALDNDTRFELQAELKRIHKLWKIPFILVTHDSDEANALGDNVLFLEQGRQVSNIRLNSKSQEELASIAYQDGL